MGYSCSYGNISTTLPQILPNMQDWYCEITFDSFFSLQYCERSQNFLSKGLTILTLSWRRSLSYRNQSIDLQSKSQWASLFVCLFFVFFDRGLLYERVKSDKLQSWSLKFCKKNFPAVDFSSNLKTATLREKCPYSEVFWSVFFRIRAEYGETKFFLRIRSECGKIRQRKTQNEDMFHVVLLSEKMVYWTTVNKKRNQDFQLKEI